MTTCPGKSTEQTDKESKETFLNYLKDYYGFIPDYWKDLVERRSDDRTDIR
jgi:hypothetical protein